MNHALRYLLDTDTCIYLLNSNDRVKGQVAQAGIEAIGVAILSVGELYFGAYNSMRVEANVERIRSFFSAPGPQILFLDENVMEQFGRFKADLRQRGQLIGDIDMLIASIAVSQGLKVVTNNTRHFDRIPGLALENCSIHPSSPLEHIG